jgi:predicted transcriptional regulator
MENKIRRLGDGELEIMMAIWEAGEPVTASCILEQLRGKRKWALSTLMTILARLCDKGFVSCDRSRATISIPPLFQKKATRPARAGRFWESFTAIPWAVL